MERRGRLGSCEDCVVSENAGLGARVDGTEPLVAGECIDWEKELMDGNDDDAN